MVRKPIAQRLWSRIKKSDHPNPCWMWQGSVRPDGYGQIHSGVGKTPMTVQQAAWSIAYGDVQYGMLILSCPRSRLCCRPSHLKLGTDDDRIARVILSMGYNVLRGQRIVKDTRGSASVHAKLDEKKARKILKEQATMSNKELAKKYNVDASTISKLINGHIWKHVWREYHVRSRRELYQQSGQHSATPPQS